MKIVELRLHALRIPLAKPVQAGVLQIPSSYIIVVELVSDENIVGLGYTSVLREAYVRPMVGLIAGLEPVVQTVDPLMCSDAVRTVRQFAHKAGPGGMATWTASAIEIAIWDLYAKSLDEPLYRVLGGYRTQLDAYVLRGLTHTNETELFEDIDRAIEDGFRAMKVFAVNLSPSLDRREIAGQMRKIREHVGDSIGLGLDNGELWRPHEAVQLARELEELDLFWFEDPVDHQDIHGLATVASAIDMPVCTGEQLFGVSPFRAVLEKDAADIIMVDIRMAGGVEPFRQIAAAAALWNRQTVNHMMTAVDIHVLASIENAGLTEYVPWTDSIFEDPIEVHAGVITVPDRPGIGCTLQPGIDQRLGV